MKHLGRLNLLDQGLRMVLVLQRFNVQLVSPVNSLALDYEIVIANGTFSIALQRS